MDLRGLRRRRDASRRRHARGDRASARPLRGADVAADRVLPEPKVDWPSSTGSGLPNPCSDSWPPPSTRPGETRAATVKRLVRRSAEELRQMRAAGRVVAEMHQAVRAAARPGVTTADLDRVAREVLASRGATSNFLGYHGFPAVICASVNDEIIHGIPNERPSAGWRHRLDRLWCDRQRLARRRCLHDGRRGDRRPRPSD